MRRSRPDTVREYRVEANWLAAATVVCILLAGHAIYRLTNRESQKTVPASSEPLRFTIDVNAATAAQLQALPDIGPKLAQRIVSDRQQNGEFRTIEELTRVHGVGPQTLANLEPMLTLGAPSVDPGMQLAENRPLYP